MSFKVARFIQLSQNKAVIGSKAAVTDNGLGQLATKTSSRNASNKFKM